MNEFRHLVKENNIMLIDTIFTKPVMWRVDDQVFSINFISKRSLLSTRKCSGQNACFEALLHC